MTVKFPLAVVGGGLAGLTATLRLANSNCNKNQKIAFIASQETSTDNRTTAILMPGVELFNSLGIWENIYEHAAPLKTMRLIDGSNRLIRAPVTDFRAGELGLEAFGYNVPNAKLSRLLETAIAEHPSIERFDSRLQSADCKEQNVCLHLDNSVQISADYAIAADGRDSLLRQAAGIETRNWSYPQTAIVLNFTHSRPHKNTSTEFHTETGPFTLVPLPPTENSNQRSSLVWVVEPAMAEMLLQSSLSELSEKIETKMQSTLGKIEIEGAPQSFPLMGMTAKSFARDRVALVGEAAHVIPPIGAQGFNLGLRDIEELGKLFEKNSKVYFETLSNRYDKTRKLDINIRTAGIDIMNRSLLTSFLPVQALRLTGMTVLQNIPLLRNWAMQVGVGERSIFPTFSLFPEIKGLYQQATHRPR